jgi:ATP-dependent Clp protease adaptor protein ClpS
MMVSTELPSALPATPQVRPRRKPKHKKLPPFAVILHNDDINGFVFVVGVLQKVFRYGVFRATALMLEAHVTGRSIVWSGSKEVAELKADQIHSCGADPDMKHRGALPLSVSIEPLAD